MGQKWNSIESRGFGVKSSVAPNGKMLFWMNQRPEVLGSFLRVLWWLLMAPDGS